MCGVMGAWGRGGNPQPVVVVEVPELPLSYCIGELKDFLRSPLWEHRGLRHVPPEDLVSCGVVLEVLNRDRDTGGPT